MAIVSRGLIAKVLVDTIWTKPRKFQPIFRRRRLTPSLSPFAATARPDGCTKEPGSKRDATKNPSISEHAVDHTRTRRRIEVIGPW
jgi:hypothetical protein